MRNLSGRRGARKDETIELLVRLPNWVGDVCKALPTLRALQEVGFTLYLAARRPLDDLVAGLGCPVLTVGSGVVGPARTLRRTGCRNALLLTTSFGTAASVRLAGMRAVGFSEDYRDWLLHKAVAYPMGEHEVDALLVLGQIAQQTFAPQATWPAAPDRIPSLPLADSQRQSGRAALREAGIDEPFTVLCPMATGTRRGHSKVWPHWSELARRLAVEGRSLVACPGPGEEAACAAAVPDATLLEGLDLGTYAAVCALAERVLANDSGPLHMAAAVGASVLGIYGVAVRASSRPLGADFIGRDGGWPSVEEVLARAGE